MPLASPRNLVRRANRPWATSAPLRPSGMASLAVLLLAGPSLSSAQEAPAAVSTQVAQYSELYDQSKDPSLQFLIAETYADAGMIAEAVEHLAWAARHEAGIFPPRASYLSRLAGDPRYDQLIARMEKGVRVRRAARLAFSVPALGVVPEGMQSTVPQATSSWATWPAAGYSAFPAPAARPSSLTGYDCVRWA